MKMKKKLFSTLILVTLLASVLPSLPVMAPSSDLVGLWHFDEGSGTAASDDSDYGNHGTLKPTGSEPSWVVVGKLGGALSFDGTNDYVEVPDSLSLDVDDVTIEAWIYIDATIGTGQRNVVRKGHLGDRCYGLDIGVPGARKIRGWVNKGPAGGSTALVANGLTTLTTGQWHHVAMTYDGTNVRVYVDGVLDGTSGVGAGDIFDNALSVRIGGQASGDNGGALAFKGKIDEVRIYKIALTLGVIAAHSRLNYEPPEASTGGPYVANEGSSITFDASDSSDPDGDTLTYRWFINGGWTSWSNDPTASFTWNDDHSETVTVEVSDGYFTDTDTASVTVNNVAPEITLLTGPTDPVKVGVSTSIPAEFTDPGTLDTHTATVNWGDTTEDTIALAVSPLNPAHIYSTPGVYTVVLTVTDDDSASDRESYEYIVVYDPNGGFVTGGGWILSPAGAYAADLTLAGKATFGFVSKYQKGASVPTGNTEFQFHVAGMNFKSTSYDWLVVAGTKAMYKGEGTINGVGNFGFMLTAKDGGSKGADTFRIKIWDKNNGDAIAYDNGLGASDTSDPTTVIAGGSIVVHK
jgi:hypothetical protein